MSLASNYGFVLTAQDIKERVCGEPDSGSGFSRVQDVCVEGNILK